MMKLLNASLGRLFTLGFCNFFLGLYRHRVRARPLRQGEIDEAARLLAEQFCLREPLCRQLEIAPERLMPFFQEQVAWAIRHDSAVAVVSKEDELLAVVTMDDHCAQYRPNPALLTDELAAIGRLLDVLKLPSEFLPTAAGETYYCGLAAVRPGRQIAPIFLILSLGSNKHMLEKGYRRAYAKVTNPMILKGMRRIENLLHRSIFETVAETSEREFAAERFAPLLKFQVALVTWRLGPGLA